MNTEKSMRENLLASIRNLYNQARDQGDTQLQNYYVQQMLPHCNRLFISVVDYLQGEAARAPAPAALSPMAARPAPVTPARQQPPDNWVGFECAECGARYTEAARYYGHISSHTRAKKSASADAAR